MLRRIAIALDSESVIINPKLVRVTAARGLLEKIVAIAKARGEILKGTRRQRVLVTIHQLYRLRIQDDNLAAERVEAHYRFLERPARLSEPCLSRLRSLSATLRRLAGTAPPVAC